MSLSVLYKIQGIESELRQLERQKDELMHNSNAAQLKEEYQKLKTNAGKWEEMQKKNESQIEAKGNEINNLQNNIKEYDSIVSGQDMGALKKVRNMEQSREEWGEKLTSANQAMQELEEEADGILMELTSVRKKSQFISRKYMQQKNEIQEELANIKAKVTELTEKIEKLKPNLADAAIPEYNKLRNKYNNPVARVENQICSGCKVEISMYIYQAIKKGDAPVKCECCGRLLYIEPNQQHL